MADTHDSGSCALTGMGVQVPLSAPMAPWLGTYLKAKELSIVIEILPKYAIAGVISELKNRSASLLREKFDFLKKVYWEGQIVGSPGYFVSSVGIDKATVMNYVKWQGPQDSNQLRMEL